jgi:hypothetical protein
MTPRQIAVLLRNSGDNSLRSWRRCRNIVLRKSVRYCLAHALSLLSQGTVASRMACWEGGYLVSSGLIPRQIAPHLVTNDRFGYQVHDKFVEMSIMNTTCLRTYWDSLLGVQGCVEMRAQLQLLLTTLPGKAQRCGLCTWQVPEGDMFTEEMCVKCWDQREHRHKLTLWRGSPLRLRCENHRCPRTASV